MATIKSIEEKAKRYDELLVKLQKAKVDNNVCDDRYCCVIDDIVPELKESEDERMMNQLHSWMKEFGGAEEYTEKVYQWIKGLLEKQGGHVKFINGIQVGDKVTRNEDGVLVNLSQLKRVAKKDEKQGKNNMGISEATKQKLEDNLNKALEKETPESWNEFLDEQGEQKPDTDFSNLRTWKYIVDAAWTAKEGIGQYLDSPFTEEVAKKLQKRFGNIEQKSTWSEEDENTLNAILNCYKSMDIKWRTWLKYLRPNHWKPSDNELEVLRLAAEKDGTCLMGLYEQLKKLREK